MYTNTQSTNYNAWQEDLGRFNGPMNADHSQEAPVGQHLAADYHFTAPIVHLTNTEEWMRFHVHQNEMMVTNKGRDVCPVLKYSVEGLEENTVYKAGITLVQLDPYVWKFDRKSTKWMQTPVTVSMENSNEIFSLQTTGRNMMENGIVFERAKIYNIGEESKTMKRNNETIEAKLRNKGHQMMRVRTQCRYVPVIVIYKMLENGSTEYLGSFEFEETKFIVVTSYKNQNVKIEKNTGNKYVRKDIKEGAQETKQANSSANEMTVPQVPENADSRWSTSPELLNDVSTYNTPSSSSFGLPIEPMTWDENQFYPLAYNQYQYHQSAQQSSYDQMQPNQMGHVYPGSQYSSPGNSSPSDSTSSTPPHSTSTDYCVPHDDISGFSSYPL
ncbi:hypothetical protein GCK72_001346 [Caenorhabditis remanei]|uniref:T-box domain-containing protein n=1 Tax=Caenorhabditis remanei TaxID=31234 RepID=A0A6A5HPD2_CAERE|nr:hypothetical protein GCK72_001346 [Caenorhabditis remanei]KAF1769529.1 hypothetical protein GCK72_001346 [Caenorhabditis remanei]